MDLSSKTRANNEEPALFNKTLATENQKSDQENRVFFNATFGRNLIAQSSLLSAMIKDYPDFVHAIVKLAPSLGLRTGDRKLGHSIYSNVLANLGGALKEVGQEPVLKLLQAVAGGTPSAKKFYRFCESAIPKILTVAGNDKAKVFSDLAAIIPDLYANKIFSASKHQGRYFLTSDIVLIAKAIEAIGVDKVRQELRTVEARHRSHNYNVVTELLARLPLNPEYALRQELFRSDSWYCSCYRAGLNQREFVTFTHEVASTLRPLGDASDVQTIERVAQELLNFGLYKEAFKNFLRDCSQTLAPIAARIGGDNLTALIRCGIPIIEHKNPEDSVVQEDQSRLFSDYIKIALEPLSKCLTHLNIEQISKQILSSKRKHQEKIPHSHISYDQTRDSQAYKNFVGATGFAAQLINASNRLTEDIANRAFELSEQFTCTLYESSIACPQNLIVSYLNQPNLIQTVEDLETLMSATQTCRARGTLLTLTAQSTQFCRIDSMQELIDFTDALSSLHQSCPNAADQILASTAALAIRARCISDINDLNAFSNVLSKLSAKINPNELAFFEDALPALIYHSFIVSAEELQMAGNEMLTWSVNNPSFWEDYAKAAVIQHSWSNDLPVLAEFALRGAFNGFKFRKFLRSWKYIDTDYIVSHADSLHSVTELINRYKVRGLDIIRGLSQLPGEKLTRAIHYANALHKLKVGIPAPEYRYNSEEYYKILEKRFFDTTTKLLSEGNIEPREPFQINTIEPRLLVASATAIAQGKLADGAMHIIALRNTAQGWKQFRYHRPEAQAISSFMTPGQQQSWAANSSAIAFTAIQEPLRLKHALLHFIDAFKVEALEKLKINFSIPSLQALEEKIAEIQADPVGQRGPASYKKEAELINRARLIRETLFLEYAAQDATYLPCTISKVERLRNLSEENGFELALRTAKNFQNIADFEKSNLENINCLRWSDDPNHLLENGVNCLETPLVKLVQHEKFEVAAEVNFHPSELSSSIHEINRTFGRFLGDPDLKIISVSSEPPNSWILEGFLPNYSNEIPFRWVMSFNPTSQVIQVKDLGVNSSRLPFLEIPVRGTSSDPNVVGIFAPAGKPMATTEVLCVPTYTGITFIANTGALSRTQYTDTMDFMGIKAAELNATIKSI